MSILINVGTYGDGPASPEGAAPWYLLSSKPECGTETWASHCCDPADRQPQNPVDAVGGEWPCVWTLMLYI